MTGTAVVTDAVVTDALAAATHHPLTVMAGPDPAIYFLTAMRG